MAVATRDLDVAIASVEREYRCRVRRGRARRLIEYVNRVWSADVSQDIREIFSKAMLKEKVDLFGWAIYRKVLGRYYNPRAVRTQKRKSRTQAFTRTQDVPASAKTAKSRPEATTVPSQTVQDNRPLPKVIGEPNGAEVEFAVYDELDVTICAKKSGTKRLKDFDEIEIVGTTIKSGSSDYIAKPRWVKIHKTALATMNDHRERAKREKKLC